LTVCDVGVTDPADTDPDSVTVTEALPDGLLVVTFTVPPLVNVTCICGKGDPLLLPDMVPPVTVQVIDVGLLPPFQGPAMV
jgi:hypothetical protein